MKIRTRDGIFKVLEIRNEYFLGSNTWEKQYRIDVPNIPTYIPEYLVLEIIQEEGD